MKATIERVTPAIAAKWLKGNVKNRTVSLRWVDMLASEMESGRWKENGESIIFNGDNLLDGQHRLMAIVKANKAMKMLIVRDVPPDVFDTLDQGRKRTAPTILAMSGEKNTVVLATTARLVYLYDNKQVRSKTIGFITPIMLKDVIESNVNMREIVSHQSSQIKKTNLVLSTVFCACFVIFDRIESKLAESSMTTLIDGSALMSDPFHTLRERLIRMRNDDGYFRPEQYMELFIKTWNAKRTGEPVNLRLDKTEEFPVAI